MANFLTVVAVLWGLWAVFNVSLIALTPRRARRHGIDVYVTGLWKPNIFISDEVTAILTPGELSAVMAHELGHIAKGHLWINLAWAIFLPFMRSTAMVVRQELEADRFAIACGRGRELASALRKLSRHEFDMLRAVLIEKNLSVTLDAHAPGSGAIIREG